MTAERLVGEGDGQLLAVGIGHHPGELLGLSVLVGGLLSARLAQEGLGQLDGAVGETFHDRRVIRRAHRPVASSPVYACSRRTWELVEARDDRGRRRVAGRACLDYAVAALCAESMGSQNDQPEDGMIDPTI